MTSRQQSRREILKAGAVLAATASFPASIRLAAAQSKAGGAHPNPQIDAVLRRAVDTKDVPGVVAVAATDKGILYEGAFGTRDLAKGSRDDARYDFPVSIHDQGGDFGRGNAARRAGQVAAGPAGRQYPS